MSRRAYARAHISYTQGLMVILDNHSSDAMWCCDLQVRGRCAVHALHSASPSALAQHMQLPPAYCNVMIDPTHNTHRAEMVFGTLPSGAKLSGWRGGASWRSCAHTDPLHTTHNTHRTAMVCGTLPNGAKPSGWRGGALWRSAMRTLAVSLALDCAMNRAPPGLVSGWRVLQCVLQCVLPCFVCVCGRLHRGTAQRYANVSGVIGTGLRNEPRPARIGEWAGLFVVVCVRVCMCVWGGESAT